VVAAACLLALPACGDDDTEADGGQTAAAAGSAVDEQARSLLPAETAESGTLNVATVLNWPPFTYQESGEPAGIDIELVAAIAQTLGLEPKFTDLGDGALITSVQNHRSDIAVSQLVTSPERREAVDFVEYMGNPLGIMVRSADADAIDPADLCGRTLVATEGTGPLSFGREYSKTECVGKGKPAIEFQVFGDSGGTILALANGRGDAFIADAAVGTYQAETSNKNLVMDDGIIPGSETYSGIAYAKDRQEIGKAVEAALLVLMENGTYDRLLDEYGIADAAITEEQVSGGGAG
jgi:polar amino acid transport system substrate-binding protein